MIFNYRQMIQCFHPQPENLKVILDDREDFPNYGYIKDMINPADNQEWDVLICGYDSSMVNEYTEFTIDSFFGCVEFKNGNHKLCVTLVEMPVYTLQNSTVIRNTVSEFTQKYKTLYTLRGTYVSPFTLFSKLNLLSY